MAGPRAPGPASTLRGKARGDPDRGILAGQRLDRTGSRRRRRGLDATWHDGLRQSVRAAISSAAHTVRRPTHADALSVIAGAIVENAGLRDRWCAVQSIENHDIVYAGREPRIARLGDGNDPRSWYARSRSRVATGLVLTSPGIPMLFMGQEILADRSGAIRRAPTPRSTGLRSTAATRSSTICACVN